MANELDPAKRRKLIDFSTNNDEPTIHKSLLDLDISNQKIQTIFAQKTQTPPFTNLPSFPTNLHDYSSLNYSLTPTPFSKPSTTSKQTPPLQHNPYEKVAKEIGATKFKSDGTLYKECTINNQKYEQIVSLGKGSSFQCYRSDRSVDVDSLNKETPLCYQYDKIVIKVFISFLDASTNKKHLPPKLTELDDRMDRVAINYKKAIELGIPCAEIKNIILNPDGSEIKNSLKADGCILQELTKPVSISWKRESILQEKEKFLIISFGKILKAAKSEPNYDWDLKPTNFGIDADGVLKLFDFSDNALKDKKQYFEQAISNWANENNEAEALIRASLI